MTEEILPLGFHQRLCAHICSSPGSRHPSESRGKSQARPAYLAGLLYKVFLPGRS